MSNSSTVQPRTNPAFFIQAAISFAVSTIAVLCGILALPLTLWVRAFLSIGLLYVITSTFTLAKVVRDRQETDEMVSRVDKARLEKLLSEHDPYRMNV